MGNCECIFSWFEFVLVWMDFFCVVVLFDLVFLEGVMIE